MQRTTFAALLGLTMLAGCTGGSSTVITIEDELKNPLFAERYAENVVDRLVELEITKDPILADPTKKEFVDGERKRWLEMARSARQQQREGTQGNFIPLAEFAKGDVLYVDEMLYIGTLFEIDPLPSLHVYLTTSVDPRDAEFPDTTALDLGPLQRPYGTQMYAVPEVENPLLYRTVVLWDTRLERLHSFAQLNK